MSLRQTLRRLIEVPGVLDDPRRFEGLLRDLHPDEPGKVSAISESLRQGLAAAWVADPATLADPGQVQNSVTHLCVRAGLSAHMAWWVIEVWQQVLGATTPTRRREIRRRESLIRDRPGTLGEHLS